MKHRLFLAATLAFLMVSFSGLQKKKVIFFGDSITQAALRPGGYIRQIDSLCRLEGRTDEFEWVGKGVSGNKVTDLFLRFQKDVLDQKPGVVVIYIGINDVWHKAGSGTGTEFGKFGVFYDTMVTRMKEEGIQPVLCTPTVIGERYDHSNQQDGDLNYYSAWIRSYARRNKIPLVDLRSIFLDYLAKNNPTNEEKGILTTDRVHLNEAGNRLVAQSVWDAVRSIKPW